MKIMVRVHDLGKDNAKNLAKKTKEIGFDGVQLVLYKAIDGYAKEAHTIPYDSLVETASAFKEEGLEVGMLGAYFNPVHSNKELVKDNIERFKEYLGYTKDFNTKYVGSETGSYNDDKWTYNPLNRLDEALNIDIETFGELAKSAKENNACIALEGAYGHCMYSPAQLNRLVSAIDNGHVKVTVDVFNYLDISAYDLDTQHLMFDESIKYFKDKITWSGFLRMWHGQNWKHIMPEVFEHNPHRAKYGKTDCIEITERFQKSGLSLSAFCKTEEC